jgi:heat shock protein HslJ
MRYMTGSLLLFTACLVAASLLSTGCLAPAGEKPGGGGTGSAILEGSSWDLLSLLALNGTTLGVLPGTGITAAFAAVGELTGSAGCNHYFGNYAVDGESLSIRDIGSTLMACLDPGVMDQESRYLSLLSSAARFRIDGDRLMISDALGGTILTFERELPLPPLQLTGTSWVLESISTGNGAVSSVIAGTEIDAVFSDDGKVTGYAGCNRYFADFNRTGTSLRFGPPVSTKMYCSEPAGTMEQEQVYLSLLGSVTEFEIEGDRLILRDSKGSDVLFFRGA